MAKLQPVDMPSNIDYFKVNKTRRNRGYSFEHRLVIHINAIPDWYARRLGGSSAGLPDIVAVNNKMSQMYAIEAKSGMNVTALYVPEKEVRRCVDIATMFSLYKDHHVLFSFKFSNGRTVIIRHFILLDKDFDLIDKFDSLKCYVNGNCVLYLKDSAMPLSEFAWSFEK